MPYSSTKSQLRFGFAAALWLAGIASAFAQQYQTLPPGTVVGNLSGQTNPSFAVTMPQLATALQLSFLPVPNGGLAQMPAATFKCNPSAVLGAAQDCVIQGLVARGAPDAA